MWPDPHTAEPLAVVLQLGVATTVVVVGLREIKARINGEWRWKR